MPGNDDRPAWPPAIASAHAHTVPVRTSHRVITYRLAYTNLGFGLQLRLRAGHIREDPRQRLSIWGRHTYGVPGR